MNIWAKLAQGCYENKLPYNPPKSTVFGVDVVWAEDKKRVRDAHSAEDRRIHELFKKDLFEEYDVADNPKREKCFAIAWERGHSSGYNDVACVFGDIVELIR